MSSSKDKESVCSDDYEMVPPEGGWGYVVCVGLSVIFVSIKKYNFYVWNKYFFKTENYPYYEF